MAGRKNGLGRGLDALFPEKKSVVREPVKKATVKTENKTVVTEKTTDDTTEEGNRNTIGHKKTAMIVKISSVEPNVNQPRKQFDEDALLELSESIKQYGVLQPLLVSDKKDYYEIIAGERRWRAHPQVRRQSLLQEHECICKAQHLFQKHLLQPDFHRWPLR